MGDSDASGSGVSSWFGEKVLECVDDHHREVSDRRMWAVSVDIDDDNLPCDEWPSYIGFGRSLEQMVRG